MLALRQTISTVEEAVAEAVLRDYERYQVHDKAKSVRLLCTNKIVPTADANLKPRDFKLIQRRRAYQICRPISVVAMTT